MHRGRQQGHRRLGLVIGVFGLAATKPTHAATLAWNSPSDCERADAVEARVEELVGRPLATVEEPNFEVSVVGSGETWTLAIVTEGAGKTSRRELRGRSCDEITDAAAVAMALTIRARAPDSESGTEPTPPEAKPEPAAPAPRAATNVSRPPNTPTARPPRATASAVGGFIGIGTLLDTAALPGPTVGAGLDGGVRWEWLRAELQAAAFAPRTATLGDGRSGTFSLLSGALLACVEPAARTVAVFGCGGFELGRLAGEGHGVTDPVVATMRWTAARLEAGAALKASPALRVAARLGVAVPFERRQFVLDGEVIHEPAALSFRAALGVDFLL
jgi:hypothetical protein